MSTQSLTKKVLISAVVALPFPYVLLILAEGMSALPKGLSSSDILSAPNGTLFYIIAWFMFLAASTISLIASQGSNESSVDNSSVDNNDDDDSAPEGKDSGTVKWFNVNKGFGFITTDAGDDVFVHFRSIRGRGRRSLRQGQTVRFDLSEGEKGMQAENVSVVR